MDDWRKRYNVALDEERAARLDLAEADKLWPHDEFDVAMAQANSSLDNARRKMESLFRERVEADPHPQS